MLVPVLRTNFKCTSWFIFLVATIAVSRWTNWCLRCCCGSLGGALFEEPVIRLDSASITPGWSIYGAMTCHCGMVRKMIMKKVGSPEEDRVSYKSTWNEWQPTCTFNSSWIRLCIAALCIAAGDSNSPGICSKLVRCCLFVCRDISWWTTADISLFMDRQSTFFDGKDIWWCLTQDIARISLESNANHQVLMYG